MLVLQNLNLSIGKNKKNQKSKHENWTGYPRWRIIFDCVNVRSSAATTTTYTKIYSDFSTSIVGVAWFVVCVHALHHEWPSVGLVCVSVCGYAVAFQFTSFVWAKCTAALWTRLIHICISNWKEERWHSILSWSQTILLFVYSLWIAALIGFIRNVSHSCHLLNCLRLWNNMRHDEYLNIKMYEWRWLNRSNKYRSFIDICIHRRIFIWWSGRMKLNHDIQGILKWSVLS